MFNFYEFEKRVRQEADTLNSTLRDERIHENQRSKLACPKFNVIAGKNEDLAKNYKTRVAHFIKEVGASVSRYKLLQMIEKPIIENDYYDPLKSLQHSKNLNLAHHTFRYTHSKNERIEVTSI